MNSMQLITVAHAVINVSSICLATYIAGIVTLLGSALVASYFPGTVLSPRQTTSSLDVTKIDLNSIMDVPPTAIENLSENVLTTDFMPILLSCNQTQHGCENIEKKEIVDEHWKWWLNSIMIWLPEYSGLESKETLYSINDEIEYTDTLITTKFVLDTTTLIQDADEFIMDMNWKQILGIDLNLHLHDWRYYANYVTKITLGHQH